MQWIPLNGVDYTEGMQVPTGVVIRYTFYFKVATTTMVFVPNIKIVDGELVLGEHNGKPVQT